MSLGIIATGVRELQLVLASGEVVTASAGQNAEIFRAALCSMGVLGVIATVTLQVVPAFDLAAQERPSTLGATLGTLQRDLTAHTWYRFWWFPHSDATWEWRAEATAPGASRSGPQEGTLAGCLPTGWASQWAWWAWGWLEWALFTAFGFHALQAALLVTTFLPALQPAVNALWRNVLFSWPRSSTARSDKAFNFNCLFKQCVRRPPPRPPAVPHVPHPPAGTWTSGPSRWRRCRPPWWR